MSCNKGQRHGVMCWKYEYRDSHVSSAAQTLSKVKGKDNKRYARQIGKHFRELGERTPE